MSNVFKNDVKINNNFVNYSEVEGYDRGTEMAASWRWDNSNRLESDEEFKAHQLSDHLKRYGFKDIDAYKKFLAGFTSIAEIGAGEGRCVDWYLKYSNATVYALEISDSVYYLREKYKNEPRVVVIKADALYHPFADNSIDLMSCEQSISNAPNTEAIFNSLCKALKPGGKFIISLLAQKSIVREKMDVIIRDSISKLNPEQVNKVAFALTDIGKLLHDTGVSVKVPESYLEFGSLAGKEVPLQKFFYYGILKCFYNEKFTREKSAEFNHDWYCYPVCNKFTVEQVGKWFINNQIAIEFMDPNEANINFRGSKQ